MQRLLAEGRTLSGIAGRLGLSRTVRRFACTVSPEELLVHDGTGRRYSILDEHATYLPGQWNAGRTNAAQLWEELRDRGYQGGPIHVRHYLACFREADRPITKNK